jgi:hypothetical protein
VKYDDQLFLGKRHLAKLRRRRRAPKPIWPDGPLDPVPDGGTVKVRLRDGRVGIMPITYDVLCQKAKWVMDRFDAQRRTSLDRYAYELEMDRNYEKL